MLSRAESEQAVMVAARARKDAIKREVAVQHERDMQAFERAREQASWAERELRASAARRRG